jgi:hypothetical protein
MFNTSNEGTGGFGISYSSREMRGRIIQIRPITQQVIQMSFIEINTKKQFK